MTRIAVHPPVTGFEGKVTQCIRQPQLVIKVGNWRLLVVSLRALTQSCCMYSGPKGLVTHSDFDLVATLIN